MHHDEGSATTVAVGNKYHGTIYPEQDVLPPFRFTCRVEVKLRVRISCLFGHSAVGSNMFCTQGNAGASCLGAKLADF
jgi:hypothetical protein